MVKNARRIKRRDEQAPIPVKTAVTDYLASSSVRRLEPETQQAYTYKLTIFAEWCATEQVTLDAFDSNKMECYLEHFRATRKPCKAGNTEISTQTCAGHVRAIKTFLNWGLLDEQYEAHIKAIAVQRIKQPKTVDPIVETFTPSQIKALFKACDKEESEHLQMRDRAILALLLDSGIRSRELITLKIGHVILDPKDPYIRVFGKGKKWGEVGLGEQSRRAVQKYIVTFREPTVEYEVEQAAENVSERQLNQLQKQMIQQAPLFVNRAGKPLTRSGLQQLIDRLGEWADIEGVRCSPHTFRHTFAKLFMQNGGDIYKLSKLLRHSSVAVTERYLRSLQQAEARKGAKSVLDNLQKG